MKLKKLTKLLEKRAKGFVYQEIQEEFSVVESQNNEDLKKNINADFCNENKGQNEAELAQQNLDENKNFDAKIGVLDSGVIESAPKRKRGRPKKQPKPKENLVLVKKKVHTFYVPPDMTAIKMLYELDGKKFENTKYDVMDLAEKRKTLLEEITNELMGEDK